MESKKQEILNLLEKPKFLREVSTSLNITKQECKNLLHELISENKVEQRKDHEGKFFYIKKHTKQIQYAQSPNEKYNPIPKIKKFSQIFKFQEKIKSPILKNSLLFILFFIIIFLVYFYQFGTFYHKYDPPRVNWYRCLDDIDKGILYKFNEGGYLVCFTPPLFLYFLYFIRILSGNNLLHFLYFTGFISIILSSINLLLIFHILKRITKKYLLFFPLAFFLYTILVTTSSLGLNYYDIFDQKLSTFLLLSSFYILHYSSIKRKSLLAGFFLSSLILVKYTNIPFAGLIFIHHIYKFYKSTKNTKSLILETLNFAIPFVILNLIFLFLHPEYPKVAEALNSYEVDLFHSLTEFKAYFSKLSWESIIVLAIILSSSYIFFFQKDFFQIFTIISILTIFIYVLIKHPVISESHFYYRYIIPAFPFFIFSIISFFSKEYHFIKKTVLIFPIILIVFPNIALIYSYHHLTDLDKILSHPITFLPDQGEDRVLSDFNRFEVYGKKIDLDKYDELVTETIIDGIAAEFFIRGKLITNETLTEIQNSEMKKLDPYKERLINREYSIIGISSIYGLSPVFKVVYGTYSKFFNQSKNGSNVLPPNFPVDIPSLESIDKTKVTILLSDLQKFSEFRNNIYKYYDNNYDKICSKSKFLATWVSLLLKNHDLFPFTKEDCESSTDYYQLYVSNIITSPIGTKGILKILTFFILILLLMNIFQYLNSKKSNLKITSILLISLIILTVILLTFPKECKPPFHQTETGSYCCTDIDANNFCDQLEKDETKECIAYTNNLVIPTADECKSEEDCKSYETLKIFNLSTDSSVKFECQRSAYGYIRPLGFCKKKEDCVNYVQEEYKKIYGDIIDCKLNACITLKAVAEKIIITYNSTSL